MRGFETVVRVAGGGVAATLAVLSAVVEAFLTPYQWALPVSVALVGNLLLFWFAQYTMARTWAWLVAAVPWFLVLMAAVGALGSGDLIANSWTGLAVFGAGAVGFFVPAAAWIRPSRDPKFGRLGSGPDGGRENVDDIGADGHGVDGHGVDRHREEGEGGRPQAGEGVVQAGDAQHHPPT